LRDCEEVFGYVVGGEAGVFGRVDDGAVGGRHCGIVEGFRSSGMGCDTRKDKVSSAVVGLYKIFSVESRLRSKTSVWEVRRVKSIVRTGEQGFVLFQGAG